MIQCYVKNILKLNTSKSRRRLGERLFGEVAEAEVSSDTSRLEAGQSNCWVTNIVQKPYQPPAATLRSIEP